MALAITGLVMMLSAKASYARWPLLGLLLPTIRFFLSSAYRQRIRGALRARLVAVREFSGGSGAVPWMASAVLVVIPVFLFYLSNGAIVGAIDTQPVNPTAVSLIREGNWDLSEFDRPGRSTMLRDRDGHIVLCYQTRGDRIYSAFPAGMVMFAAPVTALARLCGADLDRRWVHLRLEKITASLVAALTLGLFFLTACALGAPTSALVTTLLLALSSTIYTTVGLGLWQHGGITFWLLVALLVEFRSSGRPSTVGSLIQGMALGILPMFRPTAAVLVLCFGLWIFFRSPYRALLTGAVAGIAYLPCLVFYSSLYGNLFGPATVNGHMARGLWNFGEAGPLMGVLFSPARGFFVYQPWSILALVALAPRLRVRAEAQGCRPGPGGWKAFCGITLAAHGLLIASWRVWGGGHCWGSRLLTDILPLIGLLCVPAVAALWSSPRLRSVVLALGLLGSITHLPCVYSNAASWNMIADHDRDYWSWSRAPFFYRPRPTPGQRPGL